MGRAAARREDRYSDYKALNKLTVWIGRYSRTRGYGDESRHLESARRGFEACAGC